MDRRLLQVLASAAIAVAVAGCGGGSGSTASPPTTAVANSAAHEWAKGAVPYASAVQTANQQMIDAIRAGNYSAAGASAGGIADAVRNFRLALQAAGPPPASVAVEGPAAIEASQQLENAARRLAACPTCLSAVTALGPALQSYTSALGALTAKL